MSDRPTLPALLTNQNTGFRIFALAISQPFIRFELRHPGQNTSCIRKPQVISEVGGGGVRTPCTLPLDPPLKQSPFHNLPGRIG